MAAELDRAAALGYLFLINTVKSLDTVGCEFSCRDADCRVWSTSRLCATSRSCWPLPLLGLRQRQTQGLRFLPATRIDAMGWAHSSGDSTCRGTATSVS